MSSVLFNGEFSLPKQTLKRRLPVKYRTDERIYSCRGIQTSDFPSVLPPDQGRYRFRRFRYHTRQGGYILRRVAAPAEMSLGVLHAGPSCCGGISVRALRHKLRKGVPPFPAMGHSAYLPSPKRGGYESIRFRIPAYEVSATVTR